MRVKVGDTWYDSTGVPILVQLDEQAKQDIRAMPDDHDCYEAYPNDTFGSLSEAGNWMKEGYESFDELDTNGDSVGD